jgi:hypothetical protein
MIKQLSLVFFFTTISIFANSQTKDTEKIHSVVIRFFDGISELNGDKIREQTTEGFVLLENGKLWNVDSLINVIAPLKSGTFTRTNKFNFLKTDRKGDVAWISYENFAEMKINGKPRNARWLESAVLIKEKGSWKIDLLHSTVIK